MKNNNYNHQEIEAKWQKEWESAKLFSPNLDKAQNPYYNLMMFPYPSAEGLHVGNMYAFTGADVYARFNRMQGKDVFEPIGLDGFGIHSENYALKIGKNPKEQAKISQNRFYKQLRSIGNSFDWTRTVETYDPDYYRWTEWLFVQLFKAGLAYRKTAEVNWCPKDLTVLSDEQVIDGCCERCGSEVERRELEQWFFRITNYAERLLENIEKLDWTEKVKIAQRNWIGKSEGAVIDFKIVEKDYEINVFTTRADTLFGATFLVLSPEHKIAQEIGSKEVKEYVRLSRNKSKEDRTDETKEKTGVFSGLYAINPVNNEKIPVWIADYVLMDYGTGAIMAVPAHDQRDYDFAKKYDLPIKQVIEAGGIGLDKEAYIGRGKLVNSEDWNGWQMPEEINKVIGYIEEKGLGERKVTYHLRDWLISRQRYWGPPIPMIFCENCSKTSKGEREDMPGWYSVPDEDLPVLLPDVEDWKPMGTGKSPLANHPEFYETKCPLCGSRATRETDVSDTFLDSAWYFLRYTSTDIDTAAFDTDRVKKWLPVNKYIGGAEHSVLHLLYSRFITMVLHDLPREAGSRYAGKLIDFEEPFSSFFAHGLIIKDGAKMSKSKGNVVVPDEYINKYGADTLRAYLMFLGPFSDGGDFRDSGIEGMNRFIRRVWKKFENVEDFEISEEGKRIMNKTIKKVTEDIAAFKYNTAIASLMEWYNFLSNHEKVSSKEGEVFLKLLAPFAPFMTEELWHKMGNNQSIHISKWPEFDEKDLESSEVTIIIQVNGKKRGELVIQKHERENREKLKSQAREIVKNYLENTQVKKTIHVPGKIINFVI